jgi:hypothetical protein
MSQYTGSFQPTTSTGGPEGRPAHEVARGEAAEVGRSAADAGRQVAGTAAEQAAQVAQEAKNQARDLVGEARTQVSDQARAGQQKAADGIRALGRELREMADGGQQSGIASEVARQAADQVDRLAGWLGQREPGDLVEEVRSFARRRPGVFLLGAAVAGTVVGRLTRGAVDAARTDSQPTPQRVYDGSGYPPAVSPALGTPAAPPPYDPLMTPRSMPGDGGVGSDPFASPPPSTGTHVPRPGATPVGEYIDEIDDPTGPTARRPEAGSAGQHHDRLDPFGPGSGDTR